jgi:hypothetical protein
VRPDPAELRAILEIYARPPGRSAYAVIATPEWTWTGGVAEDVCRPAASLLKVAVGIALEEHLTTLDAPRVGDLLRSDDVSVLHALGPERYLQPSELHALMLSASDAPSTRWAVDQVGIRATQDVLAALGAHDSLVTADGEYGVLGVTTARDAVRIVRAADDPVRLPACARALRHSIMNARIPLGVTSQDITIAHKTGTLTGVAHDVAHLGCIRGDLWVAFLSEGQQDTLVTGYDMGLCTRALLESSGLQASRSRSFATRS